MLDRVLRTVFFLVAAAVAGAFVFSGLPTVSATARGGVQSQAPNPVPSQAATPPETGTGAVAGVVVAADNASPVRRARVMLIGLFRPPVAGPGPTGTPTGWVSLQAGNTVFASAGAPTRFQREAESDTSGRFEFRDLPAGTYGLSVLPAAGHVPPRSSDPIRVEDGKTTTLTIRLDRAGAIAGRVLDDEGEPVTRSLVRAAMWESMGGARRVSQMRSASTDDRGEFRIFGLQAGDYYVSASPNRAPSAVSGPRTGLVQTYYPGVPSMAGAARVRVLPGTDTGGIDIPLLAASVATITGTITDQDAQPLPPALHPSLMLISRADGQDVSTPRLVRPDGTFRLTDVGPGEYYLAATAFPATQSGVTPLEGRPGAYTPLSVDGSDLTVNLALNGGATVSGHVRLEGLETAPSDQIDAALAPTFRWPPGGVTATRVSISQDLAFPLSAVGSYGIRPPTVAEDGSFTVSGIRGWLRFTAMGSGVLKAIRLNGRDITATTMELAGTERIEGLELVLTRDVGMLRGHVSTGAGAPVRAVVLAFPDDESRWFPGSPFVRTVQSVSAATLQAPPIAAAGSATRQPGSLPTGVPDTRPPGSFAINPGLLPGSYHVVAIEPSVGSGVPTDRATLKALAPHATPVTIEAGRTAVAELRLTKLPGGAEERK